MYATQREGENGKTTAVVVVQTHFLVVVQDIIVVSLDPVKETQPRKYGLPPIDVGAGRMMTTVTMLMIRTAEMSTGTTVDDDRRSIHS